MKTKYRAVRSSCGFHNHASKGEAKCCIFLRFLSSTGELKILAFQPTVLLSDAKIKVIPDFYVTTKEGDFYIDFKGYETPLFKHNKKLWEVYGPKPLQIWKHAKKVSSFPYSIEVIHPKKA